MSMGDFDRLNFNSFLSLLMIIIVSFILCRVILFYAPKQFKRYIITGFCGIILISCLVFFLSLAKQASINNIPRSTIDDSYTKQSQQKYEERVKGTK